MAITENCYWKMCYNIVRGTIFHHWASFNIVESNVLFCSVGRVKKKFLCSVVSW